ncbi:hypothetical protein LAV84_18510 [Rhizobium sp. VS19-DR104.2]|uniref:hypothetical protein n=1 Tax=unclassified Rhizobium TaxID=2613769 RepID=UPI001CC4C06F|nr:MULTISPECIES: hypothetical protein [unclassified Rhizobium]MBZ5761540.1 hypothetical protein [Rhizobium sp. VS19-DR96]MBZ5767488.1 hypothetical protein [Rhizobium sp. VS19-DR129.2]MBZ5775063.1 hypothetical protein [Rhizobium sp. VS19-DRK62.2]MBZ5785972.1 hypothetical protein [Rhizobium sp. VS19-DR121]MBZ5803398.1 hypothetical protein [Rhizobium sp. VS19-DR181]
MTKSNEGGFAFPTPTLFAPDGTFLGGGSDGMTLRDWFAGQALIGMMQAMRPYSNDFARSAREAYVQADAMIAAREGGAS